MSLTFSLSFIHAGSCFFFFFYFSRDVVNLPICDGEDEKSKLPCHKPVFLAVLLLLEFVWPREQGREKARTMMKRQEDAIVATVDSMNGSCDVSSGDTCTIAFVSCSCNSCSNR